MSQLSEVLISGQASSTTALANGISTPSDDAASAPPAGWRSLFTDITNMLKAFIGLNFMYVAFAFLQAGLIRGTLGLIFIAFVTEHCCLLLVEVKGQMPVRENRKKPPTYGDIAKFVGGKPLQAIINFALMLTQFGYCVGYLIFMSQTVHDVLQTQTALWIFVFVPLPILCGLAMLKSIRSLGPFSLFANAALLTGFVAVVFYIGRHFQWQNTTTSWGTYPLFFGQMTAALEGIGLVIPVETSMRNPAQFPFVLRTALFILATVLMTVGTMGYMTFGADTKSIILLNFGQSRIVNVVKVILVFGILFTYPLQIYPVFQLVEGWAMRRAERRGQSAEPAKKTSPELAPTGRTTSSDFQQIPAVSDSESESSDTEDDEAELALSLPVPESGPEVSSSPNPVGIVPERKERFVKEKLRIGIRLSIVIATALTATLAGANFGLFQSLVGSMGASCLAYSAPAFFHVKVFSRQLSFGEKVKDWLIFSFGVTGAVVGTIATLYEFSKVPSGAST